MLLEVSDSAPFRDGDNGCCDHSGAKDARLADRACETDDQQTPEDSPPFRLGTLEVAQLACLDHLICSRDQRFDLLRPPQF